MWTEIVRPQRKKNQGSVSNAVAQQVPPAVKVSAESSARRFSSKSASEMMRKMAPRDSKMSTGVLPIKCPQKQQAPSPPAVVKRTTNPLPAKDIQKASKDAGKNYDLMMFMKPAASNLKMISNQKETALMNSKTVIKKAIVVNEEFVKHRFITTKKKKKVFSKIKKRILMERLKYQMEQQAVLHRATTSCQLEETTLDFKTANQCQDSSVCETLSFDNVMRTVGVSHFVTEQDIMDESEHEEIIANIEQIFSPFGDLESIAIMVISSTDAAHENTEMREDDGTLDRECIVFITFLLGDAAAVATTAINGSQFSGKSISASLINIDSEITKGNDDDDLDCEKKDNHVPQYQANKTKTKVIAVILEEKSNSVIEKSSVKGCTTLTAATATATTTATTHVTAAVASDTSTDNRLIHDIKYNNEAANSIITKDFILSGKCDLYLEHAVCRDDVADEEEGMEILGDLHSLCDVFGVISDVWIQGSKEKQKERIRFDPYLLSGSVVGDGRDVTAAAVYVPLEDPWTFIEFDSLVCASQAVSALNGRHIGGKFLEASLYNYDAYRCAIYDSRYCARAVEQEHIGSTGTVEGIHSMTCECDCEGAVVVVRNYVSAEDLEECEGLGEELAAIKRDLLLLCTAQSRSLHCDHDSDRVVPVEASVRRVAILSRYDLNHGRSVAGGETADMYTANGCIGIINNSDNGNNNDDNGNNEDRNDSNICSNSSDSNSDSDSISELVACVRFNSVAAATDAMLSLDGTLLSGNRLRASIRRLTPQTLSLSLTGPVTLLHVNYPDITPKHPLTSTSILPSTSNTVANDQLAIESNILNTGPVDSVHEDRGPGIPKAKAASECEIIENMKVQDPKISVYTEAVLAPKLKKNTATGGMIKIALEEVDGWVKEFLSSIATFQERLKEKDPLKAAAKRRFVMGLKQATNCVRAGSVKLLLLAPDSEDSVAIDTVLDALKELALQREVPVLYCLNRRKLGKAAHSSMKQLAVAVLDADGAYDNFKKIISFINQPPLE